LSYTNGRHADAAKVEFNDMLPDYIVENLSASETASEFSISVC